MSKIPKYTHGPWSYNPEMVLVPSGKAVMANGKVVAEVRGTDTINQMANTRLIACAPELLELLELFSMTCGCSVHERFSGHLVGCMVPEIQDLICKVKTGTEGQP